MGLLKKEQLDKINSLGYKLLHAYKNKWNLLYVVVEDYCGYKYDVYIHNLFRNHKSIVGKNNPYSLENISIWLELNNKYFELCKDNRYVNNNTNLKFYCFRCEEYFYMEWRCFGMGYECPRCAFSKGESSIKNYLKNRKIKYLPEYSFLECVYEKPLRFDFYLPDYKSVIEFHGQQHYVPIDFYGGESHFNYQIKLDSIKKKFCIDNNISLLIISYLDYKNICDILKDFMDKIKGKEV